LISRTLEEPTTCRSGVPTLNGGRSSSIEMNTSATFNNPRNALTFMVERMKKEDKSLYGTSMVEPTRNGRLSMKRMLKRFKIKAS